MKTNLISPMEAMTTPITMNETLRKTFKLGLVMPKIHPAKRTATGVVA